LALDVLGRLKKGEEYDPSWFDYLFTCGKMCVKTELRKEGEDAYKTRMFFIVTALKNMLDKIVMGSVFKKTYSRGANKIGTKWVDGGAWQFIEKMGMNHHDRAIFVGDWSKYDHSLKASILLLCFFLPVLHYSRDDPDLHDTMVNLARWCCENSVCKVLKWFGDEWVLVIGMMFSGETGTSWVDSIFAEIFLECHDIYFVSKVSKNRKGRSNWGPELAAKLTKEFLRNAVYGDDFLRVMSTLYADTCMPNKDFSGFARYAKKYWDLNLKKSDSYLCHPNDPRPDMTLPCSYTQLTRQEFNDGANTSYREYVTYRGPKFLKRQFVVDVVDNGGSPTIVVLPWRPTSDYVIRSTRAAGDVGSLLVHIYRLRSLMMDTYGSNKEAYHFLSRVEMAAVAKYESEKAYRCFDDISDNMSELDEGLRWRIKQFGGIKSLKSGAPGLKYLMRRNISSLHVEAHRSMISRMSPTDSYALLTSHGYGNNLIN